MSEKQIQTNFINNLISYGWEFNKKLKKYELLRSSNKYKRSVCGTYIGLSKKHIQSYVNEFTFRQNNKDKVLFRELLGRV